MVYGQYIFDTRIHDWNILDAHCTALTMNGALESPRKFCKILNFSKISFTSYFLLFFTSNLGEIRVKDKFVLIYVVLQSYNKLH